MVEPRLFTDSVGRFLSLLRCFANDRDFLIAFACFEQLMLHGCIAFKVVAIKDEFVVDVMLSLELADQTSKSVPLASLVIFRLVQES